MSKEFFYSQNQGSNKMLIQTFGRGNLPKYVEPNLSQRNAFEQQRIIRQKYTHCRQGHSKAKQKLATLQQRQFYEKQRSQPNQMKDISKYRNKAQLQNIDNINDKINGLIKSISLSCHKKDSIPLSNKIQKCETSEKFKKKNVNDNDMKRDILLQSAISKKTDHVGFDSFGTKKEAVWFNEQKKQFTSQLSGAKHQMNERKGKLCFQSKIGETKLLKRDDQDEMQQRIKKIQDKISNYQQKMGTLKPKLDLARQNTPKPDQRKQPREIVDYLNLKYHIEPKHQDEIRKKEVRTAKKEANAPNQKQPNQIYREKDIRLMQQKQNEKFIQMQQTKSKKYNMDKQRLQQTNKKSNTEKEQNQPKFNSSSKKSKIVHTHEKTKQPESATLPYSLTYRTPQQSTFIKSILTQIQYDQDFRHAKHMFGGIQGLFDQNYEADRAKWVKLREELKKQGFSLSINEVKQIFMPRDDQIDPFMSVSHSHDELIHGVIFAYRTAQKHWNDHIYRNWTLWELKQSNFTSQHLDRGKKGFVSLQDLTFYFNTETDGSYRNRDLLLIFNRLAQNSNKKSEHSLSFKKIIDRLLSL